MEFLIRLKSFFYINFCKIYCLALIPKERVDIARDVIFIGMPVIEIKKNSKLILGSRVSLCSNSLYTDLGVSKKVILRTLRSNAIIKIGKDSGLSGVTICAAQSVEIGNECLIGADVTICDTDFHTLNPLGRRYNKKNEDINTEPVKIGNNVFIGTKSIILKGVTIGDNSVIGAGSVVTSDIEANSIAAGNPARIIKK